MKVLELFAGSRSIGKVCDELELFVTTKFGQQIGKRSKASTM
jgi:hypothetical protein